ncbi:MAG: ATP-binding protein [Candidatus Margulisiibacteriota bacterium]|jgi:two-component system phosphate regulon sensor histidine kinase PhoR
MKPITIKKQLFFSYLIIIFLMISVMILFTIFTLRGLYLEKNKRELLSNLILFEEILKPNKLNAQFNFKDASDLAKEIKVRLTLINAKGEVLFDSDKNYQLMDNHKKRPEIKVALLGKIGYSTRYSKSLHEEMIYLAKPLSYSGKINGVLRIAEPLALLNQQISQAIFFLLILGFLISLLAILIAYLVAQKITNPFKKLMVELTSPLSPRFEGGIRKDVNSTSNITEINQIIITLNKMHKSLNEQIKTIIEEKLEKESILDNMLEGVITIDQNEMVTNINKAALNLLNIEKLDKVYFQEIIRNSELKDLVTQILKIPSQIKKEVHFAQNNVYLQISMSSLTNMEQKIIGAIIVLNDISRLKEAENLEKAFVANVSHELKTPLTVIKGFIETLLNGAIEKKEDALNFLTIINGHINRLEAIINDLLSLSKIEEIHSINFEKTNLAEITAKAITFCKAKAVAKEIKIITNLNQDSCLLLNPVLMEQALINLLDNAIKYSPENSMVTINLKKTNNAEICLEISDQGIGILQEHLPHLFKRFYRVDKSRSRESGGTGLGLAITQHILDLHQAKIKVESTLNQGSTFYIYFKKS